MKKIIINESHIRQLVKETLENLILGEDDMETDNEYALPSSEEIKKMVFNGEFIVEECVVKGHYGKLTLWNRKNDLMIYIDFSVSGYITPYYPGDYWTPPEGGELEVEDITITDYTMDYEGNDVDVDRDEEFNKYIKKLFDSFGETIMDKLNPEDFIYEPDYDDYGD